MVKKRCEVQVDGQEIAVMVGKWQKHLITPIQVNLLLSPWKSHLFHHGFLGAAPLFTA